MSLALQPSPAFLALHRFGYGAGPGSASGLAGSPREFLLHQVGNGSAILPDDGLLSAEQALSRFSEVVRASSERGRDAMPESPGAMTETPSAAPAARRPAAVFRRELLVPEFQARFARAVSTEAAFVERLAWFWSNHFAVSALKGGRMHVLVGPIEREAIRPHVLGRFADMLAAAVGHPAMLLYLDNNRSIGPNSAVSRRRKVDINENLGRELLELHTVGVEARYTQADVRAVAAALTGYSFSDNQANVRQPFHEPGPKTVLGRTYAQDGKDQILAILNDLARHPATAKRIAFKLARHFVADEPPPELVERIARTFLDSDGDLRAVARALVESDEAWSPELRKLRTPYEFLVASTRALGLSLPPERAMRMLANLGQPAFSPPSPEGFADVKAAWLAPDAIKTRLDLAVEFGRTARSRDVVELGQQVLGPALTDETLVGLRRAEQPQQAVALLLMSPEFQRR